MSTPREPKTPHEFADAFHHFRKLLDRDQLDALQPHGPAAVYTTSVIVWLLVYQRLHANASLAEAVMHLLKEDESLGLSANTGGYSRARKRLLPSVADTVADRVFHTLTALTPPAFAGRRVFILDGTTLSFAPTSALRAAFPPPTNQHGESVWPVALMVVAHELVSGCAARPELGPHHGPDATSELALALRLMSRLPLKSLFVADRNFGVFAFVHAASEKGHEVITRLTEPRFTSLCRRAKPSGSGEWTVDWTPSVADRATHPHLRADVGLKVRLIERRTVDDQPLWLLTTSSAPADEVATLYRQRLHIETDIRDLKRTLCLDEVRSRSVDMVMKEVTLGMVAYNVVVQARRLAAERGSVEPRRLSFAGVWTLVKGLLLGPPLETTEEWSVRLWKVLRGALQRKVPQRPGRSYKREVYARGRKYPPKPRPGAEEEAG